METKIFILMHEPFSVWNKNTRMAFLLHYQCYIFVVAVLLPRTIRAAVGESLAVTCVIPAHLAGVYDSSQLAFDFEKAGRIESLDDHLISRLNSTVAVLNYPEVSFDWNRAHIGCYVRNYSSVFGSRHLEVYCKCLSVSLFCCNVLK